LIQSETIMHLLIKKELEQNTAFKGVTLAAIRNHFELKWKAVATQNGLLPYIYLNWDEVGNSEFEKQNIVCEINLGELGWLQWCYVALMIR
ncbi:MAG TPA: hypothetical protein PK129_07145, partial [Cellvibrionaceae bacterium]|nr:hypothetical protein [Cellvibrionaceae bacterium]